MNEQLGPTHQSERLEHVISEQRRQLRILNEALHQRNLQLDASHYVWCTGGCERGISRFREQVEVELSEEIVVEAERQVKRLRSYWQSLQHRRKTQGAAW